MTNRIPLVVDSVALSIKELPANDNLDLTNSGIVNATTASFSGNVATGNITATRSISTYSDVGTVTSGVWQGTAIANTQISGLITATQIANTAVTASTYGGSAAIPAITVDAQGRITNASNVTANFASTGKSIAMAMVFGG